MEPKFNGQMLCLAREVRRMSQADLCGRLDGSVSQGVLSKIERGQIQPDAAMVEKIASALHLRRSFFYDGAYVREPMVSYHRKRKKLSARDLKSIEGLAEVYRLNLRKCFASIEVDAKIAPIPAIDPDQYERQAEDIAALMRQRWRLPRGPVKDVTRLVEDSGAIIVRFDFGTTLIDGFCQQACDGLPPIIYINRDLSKDRYRFTLAHELAHLVMHQTPHPEQEIEANRFAAEFLMPAKEIAHDFVDLSIAKFFDLKIYWGVSVHALIHKAWQTGRLSDRMYKYYIIEMSKRGFRKSEPVPLSHLNETPSTLKWIMAAHFRDLGSTLDDLAELFGLHPSEVRELYPIDEPRPRLRLVQS